MNAEKSEREAKKMDFNEYSILMCIALSIYSVISIVEAWGSIL